MKVFQRTFRHKYIYIYIFVEKFWCLSWNISSKFICIQGDTFFLCDESSVWGLLLDQELFWKMKNEKKIYIWMIYDKLLSSLLKFEKIESRILEYQNFDRYSFSNQTCRFANLWYWKKSYQYKICSNIKNWDIQRCNRLPPLFS